MHHKATILVTGYPYVFPYYRKVFSSVSDRSRFFFALPGIWRSKNMNSFRPDAEFPGSALRAWSFGRASLLGGIWKGWTPGLLFLLPWYRFRHNTEVVYSCLEPNLLSTLYNGMCAKIFGCRHVIFTWQNIPSSQRLKGFKRVLSDWLVRLNLTIADGIICGNSAAERITKMYRPSIATLQAPLSGIDTERFRPGNRQEARQRLGWSDEPITLFYGAFDERKGLHTLVRAFAEGIPGRLIMVGRGPLQQSLRVLVYEEGLASRVTFIEWMDNADLPRLLHAADVFVYPSVPHGGWEEQFGYAMAEASACGIPVIATNSGSIAEVVLHEKTGVLVPPGDTSALMGALLKLLSDESLRQSLGRQGREFIEKNFSHQAVARKIETFLLQFLL